MISRLLYKLVDAEGPGKHIITNDETEAREWANAGNKLRMGKEVLEMNDLTWKCHICGEERPDNKISVLTKPLGIPRVSGTQNIRYCNDHQKCYDGAMNFSFIKGDGNEATR